MSLWSMNDAPHYLVLTLLQMEVRLYKLTSGSYKSEVKIGDVLTMQLEKK